MAAKAGQQKSKDKPGSERYLKIPYHILNIERLGLNEKVLLAHIYSFGEKGCWQSNATLAEIFMISPRTIKRWLANIVRAGLVQVKSPKGYYRTIWARSHPDVRQAAQLHYRGKMIDNQQGQKCPAGRVKNGTVSGPKRVLRLGRDCPTTNNIIKKETIGKTTAPPPPLPAGGPAPAVLAEREQSRQSNIERFAMNFGRAGRWQPPSDEEFEKRRQQQHKALMSTDG